jgi:hypothetical protein
MNDEFENQLRRALRPVDAPEGFAERLMNRLPERERPVLVALPVKPRGRAREFGLPAALAASLLVAVLLGQRFANWQEHRDLAEGLAAKQELLQALRVTSKKLDLAYEAVNKPPERSEAQAGELENRS